MARRNMQLWSHFVESFDEVGVKGLCNWSLFIGIPEALLLEFLNGHVFILEDLANGPL